MSLFSWDYRRTTPADEWFRMAHAYIDASELTFASMVSGALPATYHHAKAGAFLFDQSLEHFLKAGLVLAGDKVTRTHHLPALFGRFQKLYQGSVFYWTGSIQYATNEIKSQPGSQFLRYPADASGQEWSGNTHFDLDIWHGEIKLFRADYRRLEPEMRSRFPKPAT